MEEKNLGYICDKITEDIQDFLIENDYFSLSDNEIKNIIISIINENEINEDDIDENLIKDEIIARTKNHTDYISNDILKDYFRMVGKTSILSREEEYKLFTEYKNGSKSAKDKLVLSNLKLVISIANRYNINNYSLMDLISYGNIGLLIAMDKFNPELKNKFSTYATYWIEQTITRGIIGKEQPIAVSEKVFRSVYKIKKTKEEFLAKNGRYPTDEEIMEIINIDEQTYEASKDLNLEICSLDKQITEDHDIKLSDVIESDYDIEEEIENDDLKATFLKLFRLAKLTPQEEIVIKYRYGFIDGTIHQLDEIARRLHVTNQRAGQIEKNALFKLKRTPFNIVVKNYFDGNDNKVDVDRMKKRLLR